MTRSADQFPTDSAGLPAAHAPALVELGAADEFELRIAPVAKPIGGAIVRMLAYSGSIPGPTLCVKQGSTLVVHVFNEGDLDATVHWHGLRLANPYDGTLETQRPIPVGGRFTYHLEFPDPGIYWYHPHIREDFGQEMGLYGSIVVVPSEPDYWPPVNREVVLTLDDVLLEDGVVAPFSRSTSTYTAMGRFGNVMLVNGEPEPLLSARPGEVIRLYLTDTANARVFNLALRGARMKLVGGDSGHYEKEAFVDRVILAPSERAVVDVLFDTAGRFLLEHITPAKAYTLAAVDVSGEKAEPSFVAAFENLRTNADMAAERRRIAPYLGNEPDKTLALVAEMDMAMPEVPSGAAVEYFCPMDADVISDQPGRCPKCGMKLMARAAVQAEPSHGGHSHGGGAEAHEGAGGEHTPAMHGIEWEDDMVEVNRLTTPANMRWKLIDRATGAEGRAIDWVFHVGDLVKIRLVNEMESDHPMHHPFHIHGAGRFLILTRDGVVEPNLVWKDTVLVPTGQIVDILFDVTNPGIWMAHCHIAEHHESGMMCRFRVEP